MSIMNEAILTKVLELFEKHRNEPGAAFDELHFLDFLMSHPKDKGSFRNSFSGLRRFNALWDEVQLEFGVCFSIKDRETDYSLEDFCERIEQLRNSKRSSTASLRNRAKDNRFEWNIFVFANLILIVLALFLSSLKFIAAIFWLGIAYLNYKLVDSYLKEKKYIRKLEGRVLRKTNI